MPVSFEYWKVESDSSPGKFYTVSHYNDDSWACSCVGWTRHVPRRDCRHITYVKGGGAVVYDPLARAVTLAMKRSERKAA